MHNLELIRPTIWCGLGFGLAFRILVAGWMHFTLFGIIFPTIKLKVYTCWGLMNSATKEWRVGLPG